MRLIDAGGIEGFASHYSEFDGKPLTEREKDLVKNVCGTISGQMPAAYCLDKVLEQLKEEMHAAWDLCDGGARWEAYKHAVKIVEGGRTDGQGITDPF